MKPAAHIQRCAGILALAALLAKSGLGSSKKSRVFNAQFEEVWSAAAGVAKDAFLADRISRTEGKLRFRCGPLRGYRFEAVIVEVGAGKARVDFGTASALARSYPGLLTKTDPPKRPFGAGQVRGLEARDSPLDRFVCGCKDLARLRRG
jgi:hypothetical protein